MEIIINNLTTLKNIRKKCWKTKNEIYDKIVYIDKGNKNLLLNEVCLITIKINELNGLIMFMIQKIEKLERENLMTQTCIDLEEKSNKK